MERQQLAQHEDRPNQQRRCHRRANLPSDEAVRGAPIGVHHPRLHLGLCVERARKQVGKPAELHHEQRVGAQQQGEEGEVVARPDAVVEPLAVVIKALNAAVARAAVLGALAD
eukprot:365346-Chlamydomonas_euryale.AAC.17